MATISDQWHLAAARVSPLIWEVQKAHGWTVEKALSRFNVLSDLKKIKDYIGILTSEPEMESLRDRLIVVPINHPVAKYKHPFLVERGYIVEVYDWNGLLEYRGELLPEYDTKFLTWCAGYFIRLLGVRPPAHGP